MRIYTRKGDDGTTGLYFGGRTSKDDAALEACGTVDEAQALLGLARAEAGPGSELDDVLVALERDLWVLMAELATAAANRDKLREGETSVSAEMVAGLEARMDALAERFDMPSEFVVPGQTRAAALLDVARAVVRRAERRAVSAAHGGSLAVAYLNRLSDLLWTMARWQEGRALPARRREG
ncbi:MAG: cob(I)yrinic acid a,c-diamide adenosyltransferase [Actinomycetota bacterium]|nr:cob(I)yrinic acid a,c-diamide adenosyltransferase [Actinomycetota bacterium]